MSAAKNSTVTETIASAETEPNHRVRGRFAPSPTGDLHVGSLTTAVGSYLDAKSRRGEWLVRIENCDRAREVPGAADRNLHTLESFGLQWDGAVWCQHERTEAYAAALDLLRSKGRVYPCSCTRRDLAKGATPYDCQRLEIVHADLLPLQTRVLALLPLQLCKPRAALLV